MSEGPGTLSAENIYCFLGVFLGCWVWGLNGLFFFFKKKKKVGYPDQTEAMVISLLILLSFLSFFIFLDGCFCLSFFYFQNQKA